VDTNDVENAVCAAFRDRGRRFVFVAGELDDHRRPPLVADDLLQPLPEIEVPTLGHYAELVDEGRVTFADREQAVDRVHIEELATEPAHVTNEVVRTPPSDARDPGQARIPVFDLDRLRWWLTDGEVVLGRIAVVSVELDNLAHVNERLGYKAGEHLIEAITTRLRAVTRPRDVVASVEATVAFALFMGKRRIDVADSRSGPVRRDRSAVRSHPRPCHRNCPLASVVAGSATLPLECASPNPGFIATQTRCHACPHLAGAEAISG
jgi:hypothetical protein